MPLDPLLPDGERMLIFGPERALAFGPERNLVGTLTLPLPTTPGSAPPPAGYAVLLTNVGLMPRSGPYRVNVELARRFAALGVPAMRFDLSGLGDSDRPSDPQPAGRQWVEDTRAAMDAVGRELGVDRFLMVGICSGADVAHQAAAVDERLAGIVLFDPYLYPTRWTTMLGLRHRLRGQGWRATLQSMARRLAREWARCVRRAAVDEPEEGTLRYGPSAPPLAEFARRLGLTVARGGRILLLYSGSYPFHHNYEQQTADNLRPFGLADKVEFGLIRESDHVLMGVAGRQRFIDRCLATAGRWFDADRTAVVVSSAVRVACASRLAPLRSAKPAEAPR